MKFKVLLYGFIAVSWVAMLCGISQMGWGVGGSWFKDEAGIRIFQGCCLVCLLSVAWPMAAWEERIKRRAQLGGKE